MARPLIEGRDPRSPECIAMDLSTKENVAHEVLDELSTVAKGSLASALQLLSLTMTPIQYLFMIIWMRPSTPLPLVLQKLPSSW